MSSPPSGPAPWGTSGGRADGVPPERRPKRRRPEAEQAPDAPVIPPMLGARPVPEAPAPDVPAPDVPDEDEAVERPPADPVTVAAIAIGCLGIVFLGIVCAIVTFILAAEAGRRAREAKRPADNAYFAVALAFVDGAFWIFMHYRFNLPIWVG